jgi:hypothetical protein
VPTTKARKRDLFRDWVPASRLPADSEMFMGCGQWTPEKEGLHLAGARHEVETCPLCGGIVSIGAGVEVHHKRKSLVLDARLEVRRADFSHPRHLVLPDGRVVVEAHLTDPIDLETVTHACGACLRTNREQAISRLPHRLFAPDKAHLDEDGKTAAAVESSLPAARQGHYAESAQFKGMDINTAI